MIRKITGSMIDTETLALGPSAMAWEVACVPFTIELTSEGVKCEAHDGLHAVVDYSGVSTKSFAIDFGTVEWTNKIRSVDPAWKFWRESQLLQDKKIICPDMVSVLRVAEIHERMKEIVGSRPVWFRNSAFDVPVLESMFSAAGKKVPWHRRQQSDLYTQINIAGQMAGYEDDLPAATVHSARHDAVAQIAQLADVLDRMRAPMLEYVEFKTGGPD